MLNGLKDVRAAALLIAVAAAFVAYLTFTGERPTAQERKPSADNSAGFSRFAVSDALTGVIRSSSTQFVRIETPDNAARVEAYRTGRVIQDLGSFMIVGSESSSAKQDRSGQALDMSINLPGRSFDPVKEPNSSSVQPNSPESAGGKGYFIVQFGGIATKDWLDGLRGTGVEILQYVPSNAFFVYGEPEAVARAAAHSRVRWVGRYEAEHRMPDVLRQQLETLRGGRTLGGAISAPELVGKDSIVVDAAVFARADLDQAAADIAAATGGNVRSLIKIDNNFFNVVRIEVPAGSVESISEIPDVVRIDAWTKPVKEDERAAHIIAGNYTSTTAIFPPGYDPLAQFGVDGTGVTVSVVDDGVGIPGDGGFYVTVANSVNGPLRGASGGALGHGHLNASIIAGTTPFSTLDPLGYNYGSGVAPKANIINIPLLRSGYRGTDADLFHDTVTTVGPNGILGLISNNSWGAGTNGNAYDSYAAQYDAFVRDASIGGGIDPVSIVFSAGNSGASGLTRPKMAKNIIAVANAENLRPDLTSSANNIDDLSNSSSRGPAGDGRIKPDIAAPGSGITGGRSGTDSLFGNIDAAHRWSSGTSHAAPQVAGAAALFTQHWKERNLGRNPSPALIKAAIMNTGQEMGGNLAGNPVPNGNEGWGRMNMRYMIDPLTPIYRLDQSIALFDVGDTYTISGSVSDPGRPVRVALVWTDPPAASSPTLVNDLDLQVTIGGELYRGNVFVNGRSSSGGVADSRNNVEFVWLPAGLPQGTPFSISVRASALNGDGILANGDAQDQHFALVAYNFSDLAPVPFFEISGRVAALDGTGIGNVQVALSNNSGAVATAITNPFGYYRFNNVVGGHLYTVSPSSKRYTFSPQNVQLSGNVTDLNFTPF